MKVLIVGMGKSGAAAARLALAEGHAVTAYDRLPADQLSAPNTSLQEGGVSFLHGEETPSLAFSHDLLVLSPGVPRTSLLVREALASGIEVIGELEWGYRHGRGRFVLVTGSNGKSTTTTLLGELLSSTHGDVRVGGNLGVPLCDLVDGSTDETWTVVEASSFQLESIERTKADVAVLLNITPDHQDRYAGLGEYRNAKARVFLNQGSGDTAVFSADDPACLEIGENLPSFKIPFSLRRGFETGAFIRDRKAWLASGSGVPEILFDVSDMPLPGLHNLENALAAASAARRCGVPPEAIRSTLRGFKGLPHRLELIAQERGIRVYNDSKATNTDSVLKALTAFEGNVILLLGGRDKGADWPALEGEIRRSCRSVIAFGEAREKVENSFKGVVPLQSYPTLEEAVRAAMGTAAEGDAVVLSPACASFDEFRNFEERGDRFREWVGCWMEAAS